MSLQITKGKQPGAVRLIFSGTEGIGKTTLCSKLPDALIVDVEDGSSQVECSRVVAPDWRAIEHVTKELIADHQGFGAVVYDSADWIERALVGHMLKQSGKKSIEDFGFGKGYTILQEQFASFLALTDKLIAKGVHVGFIAHTKTVRTSPPDQTDGYDRYELKLTKQVAPLLKEWSDLYLFANYKVQIVEGSDGRLKAQGGKERVMYANRCAAWDAKNRFGLPDELPMTVEAISHIFGCSAPRSAKQATIEATEAAIVADPTPAEDVSPAAKPATFAQIAQLEKLRKTPHGSALVESAMEAANAIDLAELTEEQAANVLAAIAEATPGAVPSAPVLPKNIAGWLDANAEKVNEYLVRVKWIAAGDTWRALNADRQNSIVDKLEKFARAAGIPALGQKEAA